MFIGMAEPGVNGTAGRLAATAADPVWAFPEARPAPAGRYGSLEVDQGPRPTAGCRGGAGGAAAGDATDGADILQHRMTAGTAPAVPVVGACSHATTTSMMFEPWASITA